MTSLTLSLLKMVRFIFCFKRQIDFFVIDFLRLLKGANHLIDFISCYVSTLLTNSSKGRKVFLFYMVNR